MFAVFSTGDASIVVALIVATVTLINTRGNRKAIQQINNAVNHVEPGEPTLIQRVKNMELHTSTHIRWTEEALSALAKQIGVNLPTKPAHMEDQK